MVIKMRRDTGFSLAEILVTITIIGILAGIAIPVYTGSVEEARSAEALANINMVHAAQRMYFANNGEYYPAGGGSTDNTPAINAALNIDITEQYYQITIESNGNTYTAAANRGNPGNKTYTIDQTGAVTESGSF